MIRFKKGDPSLRLNADDDQQAEYKRSLSRLTNLRALRNARAQHLAMRESGLHRVDLFCGLPAYDNCDPESRFSNSLSFYEILGAISYLTSINGQAGSTFRGKNNRVVRP